MGTFLVILLYVYLVFCAAYALSETFLGPRWAAVAGIVWPITIGVGFVGGFLWAVGVSLLSLMRMLIKNESWS